MSNKSTFLIYLIILMNLSCGKSKTNISDIEIIFENNLISFTKDSKPFSGIIIELHDNNQIKMEMEVLNGFKNGNVVQYFSSGKTQTHSIFNNGKLFGKFASFHENGNEQIITFYINNQRFGSYEEFYENGSIKSCGNYFNGLRIGQFKEFFKSGGTAIYNY